MWRSIERIATAFVPAFALTVGIGAALTDTAPLPVPVLRVL